MGSKRYRLNVITGQMDIVNDSSLTPLPIVNSGVVANGLLAAIPAGYILEMIHFQNTTAVPVDIQIGTTVAGSELTIIAMTIPANGTNIWQGPYSDPALATFNVYISSLAWGGASLNTKIFTRV